MRVAGNTSTGLILIEMSPAEWKNVHLRASLSPHLDRVDGRPIRWHVRRAYEEKKISGRTRNALLRAIDNPDWGRDDRPGDRTGKSFSQFLADLQNGRIRAVPGIGEKSVRELRIAFLPSDRPGLR